MLAPLLLSFVFTFSFIFLPLLILCKGYFIAYYDPPLGNCYVFTSNRGQRPKLQVTEPDAWQDWKDLNLLLNAEHDEYLNPSDEPPGLIITLHEDNVIPKIFTNGIHVYGDHTYSMKVLKKSVFLLPYPFETNCTDFSKLHITGVTGMEPSPRICTITCLSKLQSTKCSDYLSDRIVLFASKLPYNPDEINEEDKKCAANVAEDYHNYCTTLCSTPCHEVQYRVATDDSPTLDHKTIASKKSVEEYKKKRDKNKDVFVTEVKINYQSMEHRIYEHSPQFTTELLFSYLGGISGGWLGISLMEFGSFVEGLISVIVFSCWKFKAKKKKWKRKKLSSSISRGSKVVPVWQDSVYH